MSKNSSRHVDLFFQRIKEFTFVSGRHQKLGQIGAVRSKTIDCKSAPRFFFKFTSNAKARGIPAGPRGLEREREMGQWVAMCDTVQRLALAGACVLEMKEETTDQ